MAEDLDLSLMGGRVHGTCHCCLIFDDDDQRRRLATEYVAAGVARGELVRYLVDLTPPDTVRGWLAEKGVAVAAAEASGAFGVISAPAAYCPTGRFEPEVMIAGNKQRYLDAERAGFTATRITSEMTWALGATVGSERFLEYEAMLNTVNVAFPHFGMCQYDARRFDGATLYKVLQVHPFMVAHGQIVQNPFYVKPEEFLASLRRESRAKATPPG